MSERESCPKTMCPPAEVSNVEVKDSTPKGYPMQTSTKGAAQTTAATSQRRSTQPQPSQYTWTKILGVWAAAALPMAALAWVVAPWIGDRLEGLTAGARALLVSLTAGLVWQFVLVLLLVHRERGSVRWSVL